MPCSIFGTLVVIKRNGQDGSRFPLKTTTCMIGRSADSDIRIQLPFVSQKHCRIDVLENGQIVLVNMSKAFHTRLNGTTVDKSALVVHGSRFTVADRSFRWEFEKSSPFYCPSETPKKFPAITNGTPSSNRKVALGISNKKTPRTPLSISNALVQSPASATALRNGGTPVDKKRTRSSSSNTPSQETPGHQSNEKRISLLKRVSFQSNLSHGQLTPSFTPLKKSGRPPARRPSMPDYYGNPILIPTATVSRGNRTSSNGQPSSGDLQNSAGRSSENKNEISSIKTRTDKSTFKKIQTTMRRPNSLTPKSGVIRSTAKKRKIASTSDLTMKKGKGIKMLLGLDNAVKIVSPSSLDSKKSAALRTIHAGILKLKKTKCSSPGRRLRSNNFDILKVQTPFKTTSPNKKTSISESDSATSPPKRGLKRSSSSTLSNTLSDGSPNVPTEMFVSPLSTSTSSVKKNPSSAVKRFLMRHKEVNPNTPDMSGMATLLKTPPAYSTRKSPKSDYTDVTGVKQLFKTPRKSPKSDYSDVFGLKRLMRTPAKSPKADYRDVRGLRRLMAGTQKSPNSNYSDVHGLKRLMRTPVRSPKANYEDVDGVGELFKERASLSQSVIVLKRLNSSVENIKKTPKSNRSLGSLAKGSVNIKSPRTPSPKLTARILRSAKKRLSNANAKSPRSPSSKTTPHVGRSSARKVKNDLIQSLQEKYSPTGQPTSVTRRGRKPGVKRMESDTISTPGEILSPEKKAGGRKRTVATSKESPIVIKSPVRRSSRKSIKKSPKEAGTPLRKNTATKDRDLIESKSNNSPVRRVTRGLRRAAAVVGKSPNTPSPKSVPKGRKRKTTKNASPAVPSPQGRNLRRRAK